MAGSQSGKDLPARMPGISQPQLALVDLASDSFGKKRRRTRKSHPSKLDSHWPLVSLKGPSSISTGIPGPSEDSVVILTSHPTA